MSFSFYTLAWDNQIPQLSCWSSWSNNRRWLHPSTA